LPLGATLAAATERHPEAVTAAFPWLHTEAALMGVAFRVEADMEAAASLVAVDTEAGGTAKRHIEAAEETDAKSTKNQPISVGS
jgi:hypothetical protein